MSKLCSSRETPYLDMLQGLYGTSPARMLLTRTQQERRELFLSLSPCWALRQIRSVNMHTQRGHASCVWLSQDSTSFAIVWPALVMSAPIVVPMYCSPCSQMSLAHLGKCRGNNLTCTELTLDCGLCGVFA